MYEETSLWIKPIFKVGSVTEKKDAQWTVVDNFGEVQEEHDFIEIWHQQMGIQAGIYFQGG